MPISQIVAFFRIRQVGLVLALAVLALDDLSKEVILHLAYASLLPMWLVEGQLGFMLGWNRGMSFSLMDGLWYAPYLLGTVAVGAVIWFVYWMGETHSRRWHQWGLGLIVGGALGNLVDRIQHGAVVDFIVLNPWGLFPYTFNIADAAITIGVVLLLLDSYLSRP